jgi:anti-sigma B factor antagonist
VLDGSRDERLQRLRYLPRERSCSRPGRAPGLLTISSLAGRARSAEPVVVRLPAEIDMANAEDVGEQLRSAFTPGVTLVIADLTSTVFCDSAGARQLVLAHHSADARDAQVRFVIPDRSMLRVLTLTGLDQLLSIYPSLGAAVSAGPTLDRDAASR